MLRIRVLAVGRPRDREMATLHDRYAERIRRLGAEYVSSNVKEVRPGGKFSLEHACRRETEALLERVQPRETAVALDPSGRLWTTEEFAEHLIHWASSPGVAFLVGGPAGHHPSILDRTQAALSLSRMTLPHELARVMLAEQVYRALTLHRRVPYHK